MSVSSMADLAFARRADVQPRDTGLRSVNEIAKEKGEKPETASTVTSALGSIAAYIPTEIVTVYVAVLATLGIAVPSGAIPPAAQPSPGPSPSPAPSPTPAAPDAAAGLTAAPVETYLLFIVLTPLIVWGLYAAKAVAANKAIPRGWKAWPKWEMIAGTLAFALWAAALPASPLSRYDWFNAALAGILALVFSMLIGVFAPIFSRAALAAK